MWALIRSLDLERICLNILLHVFVIKGDLRACCNKLLYGSSAQLCTSQGVLLTNGEACKQHVLTHIKFCCQPHNCLFRLSEMTSRWPGYVRLVFHIRHMVNSAYMTLCCQGQRIIKTSTLKLYGIQFYVTWQHE